MKLDHEFVKGKSGYCAHMNSTTRIGSHGSLNMRVECGYPLAAHAPRRNAEPDVDTQTVQPPVSGDGRPLDDGPATTHPNASPHNSPVGSTRTQTFGGPGMNSMQEISSVRSSGRQIMEIGFTSENTC